MMAYFSEDQVKRLAATAVLTLCITAAPAHAQHVTSYAVGALDGNETNMLLLGATVRPSGVMGFYPLANIQAYRLGFDDLGGTSSVLAVTPAIGAGYRAADGDIHTRFGYTFTDEDLGTSFPLAQDGTGSGFVTGVQANYWGMTPELQGIAQYNWGAEYIWTMAQANVPVVSLNPGAIDVGGEVIWQGNTSDSGVRSTSFGPLVRWSSGGGMFMTLSGGWQTDASVAQDDTWYTKLSFVYSP